MGVMAITLLDQITGNDSGLHKMIIQETMNAEVARLIYDARAAAGLTQAQLAHLVGTTQPVIARLEDADYRGHSLAMLVRIATALNRHVVIDIPEIEAADEEQASEQPPVKHKKSA